MKIIFRLALLSIASLLVVSTSSMAQERTPSPVGAEVYIISPKDGAKVSGPVIVQFGLKGMGIAPAGIKLDGTGHHHLFIDTDVPTDLSQAVPPNQENKVMHFGKGQTEATLTLPPGKHTLQLVLGDSLHVPHSPPVVSKKITITVK